MSENRDDRLEDIISNLSSFNEPLQASSTNPPDDTAISRKKEEENASLALEEYLASRLQQIGEITQEKRDIKGLRTGNGWDANQLIEQVFKIEPVSIKRAIETAFSSNRTMKERVRGFLSRRKADSKLVGAPKVEFIPIWKIKGFHECYYLRTNSYRVNVKSDVVAVDVEGQSRDLILEKKHLHFIPAAIVERLHRLGSFLSGESKYFVMSDVTELASKKSESELVMTGNGRPLSSEEEMVLTSWRSKRIFDASDLKVRGAEVQVREPILSKEAVLTRFREHVIRMPERFKQILSNRLQISDLRRIYVPLIHIPVQKGLVPREIVINGSSGELADKELIEILE